MNAKVLFSILLALHGGVSAQSWEFVHREGGRDVARSGVRAEGPVLSGEVERDETRLLARISRDAAGKVTSYRRTLRTKSPDRLLEQVTLEVTSSGYRLREDRSLGSRMRLLAGEPVEGVFDPAWPEGLLSFVRRGGPASVRVLTLPTGEIKSVGIAESSDVLTVDIGETKPRVMFDSEGSPLRIVVQGEGGFDIAKAGAPELPEPPLPGTEMEVAVPVGAEKSLPGTLTLPQGAQSQRPGILLLPDAGPRGRDGEGPGEDSGILKDLAHDLARDGFSSLRYAKRDLTTKETSWSRLADDVRAATTVLAGRPEVARGTVFLVGVGEGALLALEAAQRHPELYQGLALLSMPTRPLERVLVKRLERELTASGAGEDERVTALEALRSDLHRLSLESDALGLSPERRLLKDLISVHPLDLLGRVKHPVIALYGDADPNVAEDGKAAFSARFPVRDGFRLQIVGDADGEFRQGVPRGRHPALVPFLRSFLKGL